MSASEIAVLAGALLSFAALVLEHLKRAPLEERVAQLEHRCTQNAASSLQPADVLFNPADGSAWQATSSGAWDEARGYVVTLTWCGVRGAVPWA